MNRTIPNNSVSDVITFDILSDDAPVDPALQVMSIRVAKEVNRIPTAHIVVRDGNVADEDWEVSNAATFEPGKTIEIKAGRDSQNTTIFKGIVVKQRLKSTQYDNSTLLVECKDESVKMTVGRKNRYFEDSTDSEIMETILGEYGLEADVQETTVSHREIVQHHAVDWDFILARAEANGLLVMADDGKFGVKAPDTSPDPVLQLLYGATLYDFEAELNAQQQWKAVNGTAWDYANQALFEAEAASPEFEENGNLSGETLSDVLGLESFDARHSGHVVQDELQAWTDAALLKSRLSKIVGRCRFDGFPDVKPGVVLELNGVGDRFNGKVYVTGVQHELVDGNWFTSAQFGLAEDWFPKSKAINHEPAANLLTAVNGLQIGKVVQLQDDPDGEDRILVKLPIIDNDAEGVWARVATLDAGENRGSFFRPEIDDEVVVGFLNDDPRDAIVLGMLNSSAKPAPLTASDDNHEKGLVTRSEMKMLFNDDTKVITIETPAGNSIVISEEDSSIVITDQNSNSMKMESSGITITSPGDITMEATGKIAIKATQDLSMEGLNVNAKAQAQLKAEGTAAAELSASGQTTIKGAMVMIN